MKFLLWLLVEIKLYLLIRPNLLFFSSLSFNLNRCQDNYESCIDQIPRYDQSIKIYYGMQPHIKMISSKIAKSIGIIVKLRQFCLTETLLTLYNSLILHIYSTSLLFGPLHTPTRSLKLYRFLILSRGSPCERYLDSESPKSTLALWHCNYLYLDFNST